jgi:hypothetical protein
MAQIINDAGATVLFVGREFLAHLDRIEPDLCSVRTIVVHGEHLGHRSYPSFLADGEGALTTPATPASSPVPTTWPSSSTPRVRPACPRV